MRSPLPESLQAESSARQFSVNGGFDEIPVRTWRQPNDLPDELIQSAAMLNKVSIRWFCSAGVGKFRLLLAVQQRFPTVQPGVPGCALGCGQPALNTARVFHCTIAPE